MSQSRNKVLIGVFGFLLSLLLGTLLVVRQLEAHLDEDSFTEDPISGSRDVGRVSQPLEALRPDFEDGNILTPAPSPSGAASSLQSPSAASMAMLDSSPVSSPTSTSSLSSVSVGLRLLLRTPLFWEAEDPQTEESAFRVLQELDESASQIIHSNAPLLTAREAFQRWTDRRGINSSPFPKWMAVVSSAAALPREHLNWLHAVQDAGVQVLLYYNVQDASEAGIFNRKPRYQLHPDWWIIVHGPVICSECYVYLLHLTLFYGEESLSQHMFFLQDDTDDDEFVGGRDHHLGHAVEKVRAIRAASQPPLFLPLSNQRQGVFPSFAGPFNNDLQWDLFPSDWWQILGRRGEAEAAKELTAWRNGLFFTDRSRLMQYSRRQYYELYREVDRFAGDACPCYAFEKVWQDLFGECDFSWLDCEKCSDDCGSCNAQWPKNLQANPVSTIHCE